MQSILEIQAVFTMHGDVTPVHVAEQQPALKMVLPSAGLGFFLCLAMRSRRRRAFRT